MNLSTKLNSQLQLIDEAATLYLKGCCAIMFEEQKELLRTAILTSTRTQLQAFNLEMFVLDFNTNYLDDISVTDKLFLVEQFERFFNGN